jgi:uncharacterized metal-binding protein YceD (DUF177 family)
MAIPRTSSEGGNSCVGEPVAGEFCHVVAIAAIRPAGLTINLAATDQERAALAARFDLQSIDSLEAAAHLAVVDDHGSVRLRASIAANVIQTCVVTLDPVPAHLQTRFEILFSPVDMDEVDVQVTLDGGEDPEPLDGDTIDVGEVVAQQFGINLDPYPRRPDVVFSSENTSDGNRIKTEEDTGSTAQESPFAVLRNLKSMT